MVCTQIKGLLLAAALLFLLLPGLSVAEELAVPAVRVSRRQASQPPAPIVPPPAAGRTQDGRSERSGAGAAADQNAATTPPAAPPTPPTPPPPPLPPPPPPTASLALLDRAPSMFGDLNFGAGGRITFTPPPIVVTQTWIDGDPTPLFVSNPQGPGANDMPGVPIVITQGPSGAFIASSVAPGMDLSGDNQPDVYEINEPVGSRPGAGFVYAGGQAQFGDPPADGSIGQGQGWQLVFSHIMNNQTPLTVLLPSGGGAGVRRLKVAENNSPQPRDRIFFNYNFFNDVLGGFGDVNRYTLGIEKTFQQGASSLEVRLPMAGTLASDQIATTGYRKDAELGDMTVTVKTILARGRQGLVSAGLGVAVPFGDDARLFLPDGRQILQWNSASVRLLPFVAAMSTPSQRLFWQAFWQLDVDLNGSPVSGNLAGGPLQRLGRLEDATLMFADIAAGYHVYQNPAGALQQVTAVAELHYSTTLEDSGEIRNGNFLIQSFSNRLDIMNLTMGLAFRTNSGVSIRPAMAVPLSDQDHEAFDYEAMVQVNVFR